MTQPAGAPPAATVDLGATNPNDGDKVKFNFDLPDGTTEPIKLTASTTTPLPAGTFAIGVDTAATTANLQAALTTSIGKLGDTSLVAASAIAARTISSIRRRRSREARSTTRPRRRRRSPARRCSRAPPATDSLATNFAAGDTITVNGTPITFVASGATGNQLNITDSVQTLLAEDRFDHRHHESVDRQRRRDHAAWRQRRGSHGDEFEHRRVRGARLRRHGDGEPGAAARRRPAVRHGDTLVAGTPANTVSWYTGETGTDSARGTAVARVDQSITVQYGARANEQALR